MDDKNPHIGLQTVELPITDPESGAVTSLFLVGPAEMDHDTFDRIFRSGKYEMDQVFKEPFKISPPQDFLEAATDERLQKLIDYIGEGIDAVAKG